MSPRDPSVAGSTIAKRYMRCTTAPRPLCAPSSDVDITTTNSTERVLCPMQHHCQNSS
eukprot:m.437696 g.437696  ORF g.437696 m.437696 type:complete len:58 (+) comp21438_c0_seq2:819-992(+)